MNKILTEGEDIDYNEMTYMARTKNHAYEIPKSVYIKSLTNLIIEGDVLDKLRELPDESVDCIITSPPYWGLRDYGVEGQIGLEPTLNEYLTKMLAVTAECKRVLKKTGTMWWNHGDNYSGVGRGNSHNDKNFVGLHNKYAQGGIPTKSGKTNIPEKSQVMQNYRLVMRMVDEQGWILRNQIIWHKPNVMPSSVKDRFTVDFEPVFFFAKSKKYWFEQQYEPHSGTAHWDQSKRHEGAFKKLEDDGKRRIYKDIYINPLGRTKRTVWKIATQPFKEAHFATFPEKLVEPMIRSGCPEFICSKCGVAREKIMENGELIPLRKQDASYAKNKLGKNLRTTRDKGWNTEAKFAPGLQYKKINKGYTDCGCGAPFVGGVVLDPFAGAFTTCVVAKRLGRKFIGIELNPDYIKLAEKRLLEVPESLFVSPPPNDR